MSCWPVTSHSVVVVRMVPAEPSKLSLTVSWLKCPSAVIEGVGRLHPFVAVIVVDHLAAVDHGIDGKAARSVVQFALVAILVLHRVAQINRALVKAGGTCASRGDARQKQRIRTGAVCMHLQFLL